MALGEQHAAVLHDGMRLEGVRRRGDGYVEMHFHAGR
jgi:hypothetical protein